MVRWLAGCNERVAEAEEALRPGLECLIEKGASYYIRCREQRTPRKGDRVALFGRGIAVVEQVDDRQVHAVLWNRSMLKIGRREIVWDECNMRWEVA